MQLIKGIQYNLKGLRLGLKTPRLLFWGLMHFLVMILLTVLASVAALYYHQDILRLMWQQPESVWLIWLWYLVSWLLAAFLVAIASILAYILGQVLFAVLVMDLMSRITEKMAGNQQHSVEMGLLGQFFFLIKQEIPRAVVPLFITLLIMVVGWLTPLGPVVTLLSVMVTVVLLAWDNTDLVPARRMVPFRSRFHFLLRHWMFHLGFGLWFLIPVLNILFLSFAPVGATLFHIDQEKAASLQS